MGARMVLSPLQLIPILVHHLERKLELKLYMLCHASESSLLDEESLTKARNEFAHINWLKGEHRSTENVLEHFVQLALSLTVFVTHAFPLNTEDVLLKPSEINFSIASSIISMLSMVRGQIDLISSKNDGQLGFMAKLIVKLY